MASPSSGRAAAAAAAASAEDAAVLVTPSAAKLGRNSSRNKSNNKSSKKSSKNPKAVISRTQSFGAAVSSQTLPHTLILGTHPSIKSLQEQQYYGHPVNAFWWIAGDCLGFRRDTGVSKSSGEPFKFAADLRYGNNSSGDNNNSCYIIPYEQQLQTLTDAGFGLWDVVASCERPGSLDQDIQKALPNDILGFCQRHSSIRRIVLANGGTGSREFIRHFADWLASGQLRVADDDEGSQKVFGPALRRLNKKKKKNDIAAGTVDDDDNDDDQDKKKNWTSAQQITLVSAISVSPAAARHSYAEKRDFWDEFVYQPGLRLLQQQQSESDDDDDNDTTKPPATGVATTSPYFSK